MSLVHKRIAAAVIALAVTGTGTAAYLSRSGNIFDPDKYSRNDKMNRNQINFEDQNNEYSGSDNNDDSSDSEQWQQDSSAQNKLDHKDKPDKSMIFQSITQKPGQSTIITNDVNVDNNKDDNSENKSVDGNATTNDNTYAVDGSSRTDGADVAVRRPTGVTTVDNGTGGTGGNGGSNGSDGTGTNTDTNRPTRPSRPPRPNDGNGDNGSGDNDNNGGDNSGDNNNGGNDNNGDNNGGNNGNNGGTDKPDTPSYDNNYTEKEPETPDDIYDGFIPVKPMPDDGFDDPQPDPDTGEIEQPTIMAVALDPLYDVDCIYYGEKLDPWVILCASNVHIIYQGNYYRITDVGKNFKITDYPETATDTFTAKFSYRLNENCDWVTEEVEFTSQPYKVVLADYNHHDPVNPKTKQYPEEGETLNVLGYYIDMYGKTKPQTAWIGTSITNIFLGWSENNGGDPIYYEYTPTKKGLNALYPLGTAKLPEDFKAIISDYWYDDSTYCYIQTLTEYTGEDKDISVPEGIQKVDMTAEADSIYIPASVLDISGKLDIKNNYTVSEDSEFYASRDGMLFTKDMMKICAVPSSKRTVSVPETVKSITLDDNNSIKAMIISSDTILNIDITKLDGATIYVPKDKYLTYAKKWIKTIGNNKLIPINGVSEGELYLDGESILCDTKDGGTILYGVSENVKGIYAVPEGVTEIGEDAFDNVDLDMLILPKSLEKIDASAIHCKEGMKLYFSSETAPEMTEDSIVDVDNIGGIKVLNGTIDNYKAAFEGILAEDDERLTEDDFEMLESGGYEYFAESDGATLLKAPAYITHFTDENIRGLHIKAIGNRAFAECTELTYVELGESVKYLLAGAFDGCEKLELVLSMSTDQIHIADGVFEDCPNLHCAAFNAEAAYMGDYVPSSMTASFYSPFNSYGYAWNFSEFITGYFGDIGENGVASIYGYYEDILCVMSVESSLSGEMTFLDNTVEIAPGAFSYCQNEFTIAQESLDGVHYVDTYGFQNSGLAGDIRLNNIWLLGDSGFKNCQNITSVYFGDSGYIIDIPGNCFNGCTNLKEVTFEESCYIRNILYNAFESTGIEHFVMPSSVSGVYYGVFNDCQYLEDITFTGFMPPELCSYNKGFEFQFGYTNEVANPMKIIVPEGLEDVYIEYWLYYYKGYLGLYDICDYYYLNSLWDGLTIEETAANIEADIKYNYAKLRELMGLEEQEYEVNKDEINETLKEVEESYLLW